MEFTPNPVFLVTAMTLKEKIMIVDNTKLLKEIESHIIFSGKINSRALGSFSKHYPILKNRLNKRLPDLATAEQYYLLKHGFTSVPKCTCGKPLTFKNTTLGYSSFCSRLCTQKSPKTRDKKRATVLKRYGVDNVSKLDKVKTQKEKTMIANYGTAYSKQKAALLKDVQLQKQNAYHKILSNSLITNQLDLLTDFDEYTSIADVMKFKCKTCGTEFEDIAKNNKVPRCPQCNPISNGVGTVEYDLAMYVSSIVNNVILNDRLILYPKELDIYMPEKSLAIELNELYWHSELSCTHKTGRKPRYHNDKTNQCLSAGIQLLHIWDFEWITKQDIIKSIIKAKLGIFEEVIGARKCKISKLAPTIARTFFEDNHLQGYVNSTIKYGLYHDNKLVSAIALSQSRFKNGEYEIIRFASKLNTQVLGAFTKLLKPAIADAKTLGATKLISYSDRRFFDGKINTNAGFELTGITSPACYYTKDYKHITNRLNLQKHKLVNMAYYDKSLTAWQILQLNGYDRFWDSGNNKYELTIS